jgi:hypothetical protein
MKDVQASKPANPKPIGGWIRFCRIAAVIDESGGTDETILLKRKESYGSANRDAVAA